ncbi:MAG: T9SS type A sorting domain-containing protein [Bacteroidota bacterium]
MKHFATIVFAVILLALPAKAQEAWLYDAQITFPEDQQENVFPYLAAVADDGTLYVVSSRATDTTAHNALWKLPPGGSEMELVDDYTAANDPQVFSTRGVTTIGNDVIVSSHGEPQPGGLGFGHYYYYVNGDAESRQVFNMNNGFGGYGTFTFALDATDQGHVYSTLSYQTSIRVFDFTDPESDGYGSWIAQEPNANTEVEGHDLCALSALRDITVIPGMDYTTDGNRFFTSRNQSAGELPDGCVPYDGGIAVWENGTVTSWADYESRRVTDFGGDLALSTFISTGITADRDGRLWVSGPDSSRLWVKAFLVEGDVAIEEFELPSAASISNPDPNGAPFASPNDVALNADESRAYVTDLFAKSVFVFRREGTSSESANTLPDAFRLLQNYPNPFNPSTNITFELRRPMDVRLSVFDLLGREVAVLTDGPRAAGPHTLRFDAEDLPSGVYVYRLEVDGQRASRSLILSR